MVKGQCGCGRAFNEFLINFFCDIPASDTRWAHRSVDSPVGSPSLSADCRQAPLVQWLRFRRRRLGRRRGHPRRTATAAPAAVHMPMVNSSNLSPKNNLQRKFIFLGYAAVDGPSYNYKIPESHGYDNYGPPNVVHEAYGPPKPTISYIQEPHSAYGTPEYNGKTTKCRIFKRRPRTNPTDMELEANSRSCTHDKREQKTLEKTLDNFTSARS